MPYNNHYIFIFRKHVYLTSIATWITYTWMFSLYTYNPCGSITHDDKRAALFPLASKLIYKILYVICYIQRKNL